jgi:hypothetical protein
MELEPEGRCGIALAVAIKILQGRKKDLADKRPKFGPAASAAQSFAASKPYPLKFSSLHFST